MNECGTNRDGCEITEHNGFGNQYPYECKAKTDKPYDTVFMCSTHGTWWHKFTRKSLGLQHWNTFFPNFITK